MQRIPIVLIVVLILVAFFYYPPLRNMIFPGQKPPQSLTSDQEAGGEKHEFDKLSLELYATGMKLENLRGKVGLLNMAQKNRDWFTPEEYAQIPILLAKAEEEIKTLEAEYEKVKIKYAQDAVAKMIKESTEKKDKKKS